MKMNIRITMMGLAILLSVSLSLILQPTTFSANNTNQGQGNNMATVFDDWGASFQLPSSKWIFIGERDNDKAATSVFTYFRKGLIDSSNEPIYPNINFIFEKIPKNMDVASYSKQSLKRVPIQIKSRFTAADGLISLKNALGFIGTYVDPERKEHTVVLVHAVSAGKGMQVAMDVTTELSSQVTNEFYSVLRSLTFN